MKKLFLLSAVLLLSACDKLDGTYTDNMGITSYTFESNGKMTQSVMGMAIEMNYEVDGNKVKLIAPQGTFVLTLLEDGSIQGPMGSKFTKQKK